MTSSRIAPRSGWFLIILGAVTALSPLGIDTSLPALPLMARTLHTSDAMIQATLGAFLLALAAGQPVIGPLSDHYGRRPVILIGLAVYIAAGIVCATASDAGLLVAARFVQGLGGGTGGVVVRAMIRDAFTARAESAKMQAFAAAITGVVPMLAPLLGAAILPFGWRAIYTALVIAGVVVGAAALIWLPETLDRVSGGRPTGIVTNYRAFLRLPRSPALCLLAACSFAGLFASISGSPFVLVREMRLSNAAYGFAFALSSGAILTGSWLAGALAHQYGSERLLGLASAAAAVSGAAMFALTVLAPHAPPAWAFVAVMTAYALSFGILQPNLFAAGMENAGQMAGVAAGLLGATQMLGGSVGSTINGILPYKTYVDVGISVGIAGLGCAAAYAWSIRGGSAASVALDDA